MSTEVSNLSIMLKNIIKIVLRKLRSGSGCTLINLLVLKMGITCSLFLMLYILHEMTYDKYQDNTHNNIYKVVMHVQQPDDELTIAMLPTPLEEDLHEDHQDVEKVTPFSTSRRDEKQGFIFTTFSILVASLGLLTLTVRWLIAHRKLL